MPRIRIKIDKVFLILFLVLGFLGNGFPSTVSVLMALALHELSHLFFSHALGYQVSELKLTPLGGCIRIDPLFEVNPDAELVIAASGPLSNLLMAGGVFYLGILGISNHYLECWQKYNFFIGMINLIPAIPLDGGRIIHAWLNQKIGLQASASVLKTISWLVSLCILGIGTGKILAGRGGALYFLVGLFILFHVINYKSPELNLAWKLLQHKKKLLNRKGLLNLKPVLVNPETLLRTALQRYGTNDYLLFYILNPPQKITIIGEESAWNTLLEKGFNVTFREALEPGGDNKLIIT
jgi:stage IV sporulation protein FB